MTLRLFTTPLLAATLLLGTLGCSKKDDPVAPTTTIGKGSYTLAGTSVSGDARAYVTTANLGNGQIDLLQIVIVDTPQLQSNTKSLLVAFQKPVGQPTSAYQLAYINYGIGSATTSSATFPSSSSAATLTEVSSGVYSGTFSGTGSSQLNPLTNGIFTNARL